MKNIFDLTNKNIVITAGASYLGEAMTEALLDFGANVIVCGRNSDKCQALADKLGKNCYADYLDITDEDSIKKAFDNVIKKFGCIDVLINNASFSKAGNFHEITGDDFKNGIDGTVNGMFNVTSQAIKGMLMRNYGNIINMASMYGVVSPNPKIYGDTGLNNPASYGAGKAAIIQLTRYLACSYGKNGIRVNCISPGPFPTKKAQEDKFFIEELCKKNPLGRIGSPDELKGVVVFLASDASSYVTGQNISVDGGWTSW